jgi:hypothetical protein
MKLKLTLTSLVALALLTGSGFAVPKPPLAAPIITCGTSTGSSINLTVTGGAQGAPAGFTVQWLTLAEYQANGWSSTLLCDASFSGQPTCSQYNLAPNASVTVQIGDNLFDGCGESSNCASQPLQCGTTYVFRAFAHANSTYNRSPFTANLQCSTLPCGGGGCTYTQGFWKTHGPTDDCLKGNNTNQWPASVVANGLLLGMNSYTADDLCNILNTPARGNGLISLAHQLISAKLNIANGADGSALGSAISDADALVGLLVIPPVGGDILPPNQTSALTTTLDNYNSGLTGPGHCLDETL